MLWKETSFRLSKYLQGNAKIIFVHELQDAFDCKIVQNRRVKNFVAAIIYYIIACIE